jgi:hypothetical protein
MLYPDVTHREQAGADELFVEQIGPDQQLFFDA